MKNELEQSLEFQGMSLQASHLNEKLNYLKRVGIYPELVTQFLRGLGLNLEYCMRNINTPFKAKLSN